LRQVPRSRLLLKYRDWKNKSLAQRTREIFAAEGIDPQRIELLDQSSHQDLLAAYNRVDVALDTFPYSGGLTTCEALWMGVPVLTIPGETFAGRHSLTHLSNVGLNALIAPDLNAYVERAVRLGDVVGRLEELR